MTENKQEKNDANNEKNEIKIIISVEILYQCVDFNVYSLNSLYLLCSDVDDI